MPQTTTVNHAPSAQRALVQRHWEHLGTDHDLAHEMYHDDAVLDFRGDKVERERIYVMEGWAAPDWRVPWRADTPADPPP